MATLAIVYFIVLLSAPMKWLFSLAVLIYAVAMLLIADGIRAQYGSGNIAYAILLTSAALAALLFILIPLIHGIFRLCLIPFVANDDKRKRLSDALYWFLAGLSAPFLFLMEHPFARYPGTILIPVLLGTSILALVAFLHLRRRGSTRAFGNYLPGYALGVPIMLGVSLYYGAKVLPAAEVLAKDTHFCIESGQSQITSLFDMTPLTMVSREYSEYHAELIVETTPKPGIYNWSWWTLSFSPVKPSMYTDRKCSNQ